MTTKLTDPQKALLQEMIESRTGGLFIDKWRRYWRTAQALEAKGYIEREAIEFTGPQIWFQPTEQAKTILTEKEPKR